MNIPNSPIIDIIAPAGKIKDPAGLASMEAFIKQLGLQLRVGQHIFGDHAFLSNTLENRFADLSAALLAPDSKIICCVRGGSGSAELLPLLAKIPKPPIPKLFIGFSDITSLLIFFREQWGWTVCHGAARATMTNGDNIDETSRKLIEQLLVTQTIDYTLNDLQPLNNAAKQSTEINAEIIGGNLIVISHLLGTPYAPHPANKILLLEDINEPAYKVRRALVHLQQAGLFNNIAAILFGSFSVPSQPAADVQQELSEFAQQQSVPVLQTSRIGHTICNDPMLFGPVMKLALGEKAKLSVHYSNRGV